MSSYFEATFAWKATHPGAIAALLVMSGAENPENHPALDDARERLEAELRARFGHFDRPALRATEPIAAYDGYYRGFGQTYHVQHQVESVAVKGKAIPRRAALVEAMFMAELETQVLTAGHDADLLQLPVTVDVAKPDDEIGLPNGTLKSPPVDDMLMRDGQGIISTVILGPDGRTRITPQTTSAAFAIYAPAGVTEAQVSAHLTVIERNVRLISPTATTEAKVVMIAGSTP
jgi:DNA/RNA-binding domain of Phe-tRNA-synthetase-like protein